MAPPAPVLRVVLSSIVVLALALALAPASAQGFDGRAVQPVGAMAGAAAPLPLAAAASAPPSGFQETVAFGGLSAPTSIRFAADGRVFVAEKGGRVLAYDSMTDTTPTVWADLSAQVHNFWDRGLLGLALDPQFTTGRPFVYVLYTYDKDPSSSQVPRWGDGCPTPPGPTGDGCVVSGRLSKLSAGGTEQVLITDWCQQYPSHSIGDLVFGADGALYVSAGDGASFNFADYGQDGTPVNPCGDPPGGVGGVMTPPGAEGGALRSQDVRTGSDPTSGDGTILRVDPDTGAASAGNPQSGSADPMTRRIVAHGLRNPFRLTVRPGTSEIWAGDVGWNEVEEIERISTPTSGVSNFGWPCYEGPNPMGSYDNLNLSLCETLYAQPAAHSAPVFSYRHSERVVPGEACSTGTSAIAGLAFATGTNFPARFRDGLFFADYSRRCIWFAPAGAGGQPDFTRRETFASAARGVVNLAFGPDGALYYPSLDDGDVKRIAFLTPNSEPVARASATPSTGAAPLAVQFDGTASTDPEGQTLSFAWDLDGDGAYDDATGATPTWTYTSPGTVTARLRVTDPGGLQGTVAVAITAGTRPQPAITAPVAGTTWAVGDSLGFAGGATDGQGGTLPASALRWRLLLQHCSPAGDDCHTHVVQTWENVAAGSFVAPDHEYPSHLELELTAIGADGLTNVTTRRLDPRTVALTFESSPPGLQLSVGAYTAAAPFTRTVIAGSTQGVVAPSPQSLAGSSYSFGSWSDGGGQSHSIVAPAAAATYRATFVAATPAPGLVGAWGFEEGGGNTAADSSGRGNAGAISGATRTGAGRYGGSLAFDGIDDWVTVADADSLDLSSAMTLEAWVHPTAPGSAWRTALLKEASGTLAYGLYASDPAGKGTGHAYTSADRSVRTPTAIPVGAWTHLATTWDGATLRLYRNGVEVATRAVTGRIAASAGPLRFGGNAVWPEPFAGRLDEIRVYDRALTPAQVAADMSTPVQGGPPPTPRLTVTPANLTFSAVQGAAPPAAKALAVANAFVGPLGFSTSDDASWLTVAPAAGSAPQDLQVSVNAVGLAPGTYTGTITVAAPGADGSPAAVAVTLTVTAAPPGPALEVAPASLGFSATAGGPPPAARTLDVGNSGGGTLTFSVADDAAWLTTSPAGGTAPQAVTVAADAGGLAPGQYTATVTVTAAGAGGSPRTVPVTFTVVPSVPPPTGGLVAAYGFDETSGGVAVDASGAGNAGVISGATRVAAGRLGGALEFDGIDDWVTVADAPSLDLTTSMTLEAWVSPSRTAGSWRTVLMKEQSAHLAYALYGGDGAGRPSAHAFVSSDLKAGGPGGLPLNAWSHLAATYDGAALRLFVNGTQVGIRAVSGPMRTSAQVMRIGGNAVWNEWFQGRIDEVRVYNRALSAAEIGADMTRPVGAAALARVTVEGALARRGGRANLRRARRHASVRRERARRGLPLRRHAAAGRGR